MSSLLLRLGPPVESRLLLGSTPGANSSLVPNSKCIESRKSPLSTGSTRRSPQVSYILVPSLSSCCLCGRTGTDSLIKSPGWRKVWQDEPRIPLTYRGRFFPSSLSLRSTFTRSSSSSSSSSEQSAAARWLGRVGSATGPVNCRATAASFQIKGRASACAWKMSLAALISYCCFSLSV